MTPFPLLAATAAAALLPMAAAAQTTDPHAGHGMTMPMPMPMPMPKPTPGPSPKPTPAPMTGMTMPDPAMPASGSGTARLPAATGAMHGVHVMAGDWAFMIHGYALAAYTDQSGPRGDAMAFVQTMAMLSAARPLGDGAKLELRAMMSLDPLMGARGYPNLLATGETAGGIALVDRQHPHDLFMELSARIDVDVAPGTTAFLYGGPVAEPALGPSAFMHRASARYLPLAPITHHWFDSTHITYGVATAGLASTRWQVEASVFTGREPDERRWNLDTPRFDSWSVRATWTPTPNWAAQVSYGFLTSPEALHGDENERRTTASVSYARGPFNATAAFSAKDRSPGPVLTAWLAEASWELVPRHNVFGRIEHVANDELIPDGDPLHGRTFRVTRFEGGYAYRIPITGPVSLALGGSLLALAKPGVLDAAYGGKPTGYTLFAKLSVGD